MLFLNLPVEFYKRESLHATKILNILHTDTTLFYFLHFYMQNEEIT